MERAWNNRKQRGQNCRAEKNLFSTPQSWHIAPRTTPPERVDATRENNSMKRTEQNNETWEKVVKHLQLHGNLGQYGNDCISRLSLKEDTGTKLILSHSADMLIDWVEINYLDAIMNSAACVLGGARMVEFRAEDEVDIAMARHAEQQEEPGSEPEEEEETAAPAPVPVRAPRSSARPKRRILLNSGLNSDYTFDNYVVGSNNEFAYAAAKAVATNDERLYNPLFVYGASGLGKTHLLQAIGNAIRERREDTQVLYVTSESFMNAYIEALGKKGDALNAFRRKYRKADVLIIDDVQFLARAGKTQEEFFHTFNQLFGSGKQIILSADCSAAEITNMDARLVTRFEQGMTVHLLPPCYETRVAILRRRLKQWKSKLITPDVVDFLAKNITHNVRALEGALVRLATFASFCRRELTVSDAREQLKDLLTPTRRHVAAGGLTVEAIQERVAEEFNIRLAEMNGRRRTAAVAHPRQVAMYLARKHTEFSLQEIGAAFGGRDHGTVLHAARSIEGKLKEDTELRARLERIMTALA